MNYLVCMLLLALTIGLFLHIISKIESGRWTVENFNGPQSVLRELILGRRLS